MNEPKPPPDPPAEGISSDPHGNAPHGVPEGIHDDEAKGLPHSDRGKTEKAVTNPER